MTHEVVEKQKKKEKEKQLCMLNVVYAHDNEINHSFGLCLWCLNEEWELTVKYDLGSSYRGNCAVLCPFDMFRQN